jgi:hypothetical protein
MPEITKPIPKMAPVMTATRISMSPYLFFMYWKIEHMTITVRLMERKTVDVS